MAKIGISKGAAKLSENWYRAGDKTTIPIGDDAVIIQVVEIGSINVRLGFEAPPRIKIDREELALRKRRDSRGQTPRAEVRTVEQWPVKKIEEFGAFKDFISSQTSRSRIVENYSGSFYSGISVYFPKSRRRIKIDKLFHGVWQEGRLNQQDEIRVSDNIYRKVTETFGEFNVTHGVELRFTPGMIQVQVVKTPNRISTVSSFGVRGSLKTMGFDRKSQRLHLFIDAEAYRQLMVKFQEKGISPKHIVIVPSRAEVPPAAQPGTPPHSGPTGPRAEVRREEKQEVKKQEVKERREERPAFSGQPTAVDSMEAARGIVQKFNQERPSSLRTATLFTAGLLRMGLTSLLVVFAAVPGLLEKIGSIFGIPLRSAYAAEIGVAPFSIFQMTGQYGDFTKTRFARFTSEELQPVVLDRQDIWGQKIFGNAQDLLTTLKVVKEIQGSVKGKARPLIQVVGNKVEIEREARNLLTNKEKLKQIEDIEDRILAALFAHNLKQYIEILEPKPDETTRQTMNHSLQENKDAASLISQIFEDLKGGLNFVLEKNFDKDGEVLPYLIGEIIFAATDMHGQTEKNTEKRAKLLQAALIKNLGLVVQYRIPRAGQGQIFFVVQSLKEFVQNLRNFQYVAVAA